MKQRRMFPRLSSMILALACLMQMTALADESTTTLHTAYKNRDANTEIYLVTGTPGPDYPTFGAKYEPTGGVYYGRTSQGGTLSDGRYGMINLDQMAGESAVSYYYSLTDSYSLEYWSYIFGPAIEDGKRAFLVYLNFENEGSDCAQVTAGAYDGKLQETFSYLSTLSCPVFVRIGGEMNVWDNRPEPEQFIAAYRHVGDIAHAQAPNVALVFSPNFSSAYQVDMDSFYPGDSYVDWVGVSLYYNRYSNNGDRDRDAFYGVGVYGDALLNVQQTVNLSKLHSKPVIVTEGGSSNKYGSTDNSDWAAERMEKAMAYLTMLYPQIKCIVHSDYGVSWEETDYTFYNNPTVTAAYRRGAASNPTLLESRQDTGKYYTKASSYQGAWTGSMELAAYTYSSEKLVASWYIDDVWKTSVTDYPYHYTLDTSALSAGSHTVRVTFANGASQSQTFQVQGGQAPAAPAGSTASPTNDKLYVEGQIQTPTVYKIDGSNYFKLRDIAALLSGSAKQFAVGYDEATGSVTVTTGQSYTGNGSELAGAAAGGDQAAQPSQNDIYVNGQKLDLTVYKIGGSNYFKLRDLGQALDFYVGYDPATGVSISGGAGYSA